MFKTKTLAGLLLITMVTLFAQVGTAFAAPVQQGTTPIAGTIQGITTETDSGGVTTVLVTVLDNIGGTQTVRISVDTAIALGLVTLDTATNQPVVDPTRVGQPVELDPTTVIPDHETEDESVHPIATILAAFFGADASVVNGYHEDGFGFGVIAQALWMSKNLSGDPTTAGLILEAKKTGDYSAFVLPDGSSPSNWGQFKKALREKGSKQNLGVIVSGHAGENVPGDASTQKENGKGNNKDNGNGKDKSKNKP